MRTTDIKIGQKMTLKDSTVRGGELPVIITDILPGLFGETLYEVKIDKRSRKLDIRSVTREALK